jgi:hypothetical protein
MSEFLTLAISAASFVTSLASLLFTVAAYRKLDDEASETFAVIGADEGNHEARLERLEIKNGLTVLPSPTALVEDHYDEGCFDVEFSHGHEDAELRALEDEAMHSAATNEGMAHGN